MRLTTVAGGVLLMVLAALRPAGAAAKAGGEDPFLWLEDVDGERAMSWVRAENRKTQAVLERDPRFAAVHAAALAIFESKDRLPSPRFLGGAVYNFWQDPDHVRGIWRRTTLAEYRKPEPAWTTVLDLDALAAAEHANWFWQGADCEGPRQRRCMLALSDGSEDATTLREFDLELAGFVTGGFVSPTSKQQTAWLDSDDLLIARNWGEGTLTRSGYPFVVKVLRRGEPLTAARELLRGKYDDVGIELSTLEDGTGHRATLIQRGVSFFENELYLVRAAGPARLNLPLKTQVEDLVGGQLIVRLNEDWTVNGERLPQGALVSLDLDAAYSDPEHLAPQLLYVPGPREAVGEVTATRGQLLVTRYDNVRGRAAIYTPAPAGGWSSRQLQLPDNASIAVVAADLHHDRGVLSVTGFLTPSSYWLADAADGGLELLKTLPAQFDASRDVVEQYEAISRDGTRIPYFIVHRREQPLDGHTPTILYAYGGFQVAETPRYSGSLGKLWLERGGAYVLANIRGGGEFGPAWHEAGLKTHRQRIYDDFAAVGVDLIKRGFTSPRRLGIEGGSNGGLLMGVEFNQHPELWHAVDIQVPLLDMLRIEQIAAGASWVGEYGSVGVPEERAFLASISPYHNLVRDPRHALPLIWTTTKDDRVGPQHARKFAAKLASLGMPYLYYEVIEGGHAAGANLKEKAYTTALEMTYFIRQLMD